MIQFHQTEMAFIYQKLKIKIVRFVKLYVHDILFVSRKQRFDQLKGPCFAVFYMNFVQFSFLAVQVVYYLFHASGFFLYTSLFSFLLYSSF